ncbi:copulatory PLuG formation [Caenorhabditis elegans]|uniref:copulatory PLuG formation n=1 Tax=Caenorhabditis elegans TaxID=6239 RepID=UPI000209C1A5|nr:copulatory PLuG formation [Caenorhabditis elegans]CCD71220.3 copulatory PLuG formation [Caenorhabditis elegans]
MKLLIGILLLFALVIHHDVLAITRPDRHRHRKTHDYPKGHNRTKHNSTKPADCVHNCNHYPGFPPTPPGVDLGCHNSTTTMSGLTRFSLNSLRLAQRVIPDLKSLFKNIFCASKDD